MAGAGKAGQREASTIPDILQYVSFVGLIAALGISLWQSRATAKQSAAATAALQQNSSQELLRHSVDFLYLALKDEPALLAWFLESRGFPVGTEEENKRYLLLFVRLDIHDAVFVAYRKGILSSETWQEWLPSMQLDLHSAEGQLVWKTTRPLYSPDFRTQVDALVRELPEDRAA